MSDTTYKPLSHPRKISQIASGETEMWGTSDGGNTWYPIYCSPTGEIRTSPIDGYEISDKDDDASPNYYGFVNAEGGWYIMKEIVSAGADTYRYIKGTSGYTTNWTGRAGLSYGYFNVIF